MNSEGLPINNPTKILEEQVSYFQKLYSSRVELGSKTKQLKKQFLQNIQIPKLGPNEQATLSQPITIKKTSNALKEMANDKAPGLDGFTTNFYKFFWPDVREILHASYTCSFEEELSSEQRIGVLSLIPKKDKDLRYLTSW